MDGIPLGASYTWKEARARGVTRGQIALDGLPIARGLYVSRAFAPTLAVRCRAWTKLLPPDATFGLETAAALLGAQLRPPAAVQIVLRPRPVLPRRGGLQVHVRDLREDDVVVEDGLRITSGAQTFLDLAARLPPAELVAVGDALMRAGHLTADELSARLARADGVRGVTRGRACAPLLTPEAQSRPESLVRYWIHIAGLPLPTPQVPVRDRWGREIVHADLGYEEWKVALEYEGRQHADPEQFGRDIDRYSLMGADGWLLLRYAGRHLARPATIVDRTERALRSRGWRR
ncbi:hypothetical protein [Petropleomorpha daqingensis]|uniref:Very-short-patch-repair endonuclease n=1 Tax=Petropleomorpha daqingensis TaxID=2026353 RepID=A0A853CB34_9ACTN|nr:hypothetical protein [Petropleomorpha daqingensis]NYJ04361.1 very-short-patch-repair endonuclease [Petropleomorpha daqingensis]